MVKFGKKMTVTDTYTAACMFQAPTEQARNMPGTPAGHACRALGQWDKRDKSGTTAKFDGPGGNEFLEFVHRSLWSCLFLLRER